MKIDRWYSLCDRIFRDRRWVQQMYVAHDLTVINNFHSSRAVQLDKNETTERLSAVENRLKISGKPARAQSEEWRF